MNIIFGKEALSEVGDRYTVLELDTIKLPSQAEPMTAYCLVENIPIMEIAQIDMNRDLHRNLIKNYGLRNWKFCEDAIEHLVGKWGGELDSFYLELSKRIGDLKQQNLEESWSPILDKNV